MFDTNRAVAILEQRDTALICPRTKIRLTFSERAYAGGGLDYVPLGSKIGIPSKLDAFVWTNNAVTNHNPMTFAIL